MSENVGASTSRNPKGLHGLYRDNFTLPYHVDVWETGSRVPLILNLSVDGAACACFILLKNVHK
jgi:hypothetical protein